MHPDTESAAKAVAQEASILDRLTVLEHALATSTDRLASAEMLINSLGQEIANTRAMLNALFFDLGQAVKKASQ